MLCSICVSLLRGGREVVWTGKLDYTYQHHNTTTTLRRSSDLGCTICIALTKLLLRDIDLLNDLPLSILASLQKCTIDERPSERNYRLDFNVEKKYTRTFLLKQKSTFIEHVTSKVTKKIQTSAPSDRSRRIVRSLNTSSDEVLQVTSKWMSRCKCASFWNHPGENWYPKRLLDLEELRNASGLQYMDSPEPYPLSGDLAHCIVRLVESDKLLIQKKRHNRYVTLSHCWGRPKSTQGQLKLTLNTEQRFTEQGIALGELSKTFREAVLFASRLEGVGYIWIDSLCIRQTITGLSPEDSQSDWLEQSAVMGKVYQKSYLNISATAAIDGDRGLFFPRQPEYLWEDEVRVYFASTHLTRKDERRKLTRCTLVDPHFWDEVVEQAPVNQRGWVLQERLLAPRILHFCHNQVAWECAEFQDAEAHMGMTSTLKLKSDDIVDEGRMKDLTLKNGLALRELRLNGYPDPDKNMANLYVYELWKHIVEIYSQTKLSYSSDKLIALAGIARSFHEKTKCDYVAGLWENHLESQLLWQVNEVYEDGIFENPARRDSKRAPSFSWASIDFHHGIIYGEATDYAEDRAEQLFIKVKGCKTVAADPSNPFGLITEGWIKIQARYLHPIKLQRLKPQARVPYSWGFRDDTSKRPLTSYNLYLDAPESDSEMFRINADLYCMPVAYGERTVTEGSRYLMCLLLQLEESVAAKSSIPGAQFRVFRRIGITKLSYCMDERSQRRLLETEVNELIYLI